MDARHPFYAQVMSGLEEEDHFDLGEAVMFPQHHLPAQHLLDISPRAASMCDLGATAGVGLAMMDIDPLAKAFCAGLDGRNRED